MTIRALLSHRSGLPNYTDIDVRSVTPSRTGPASSPPTRSSATSTAFPPSEPDQHFAYSNTNYILLGQLIEQLDGTDLNTALHKRITGHSTEATRFATGDDPTPTASPPGGHRASSTVTPTPTTRRSPPVPGPPARWSPPSASSPPSSPRCSPATHLRGIAHGDDHHRARRLRARTGRRRLRSDQSGYAHNGAIFGYTAIMAIDPATGDTVIIATNNDDLVADQLAARIIENW